MPPPDMAAARNIAFQTETKCDSPAHDGLLHFWMITDDHGMAPFGCFHRPPVGATAPLRRPRHYISVAFRSNAYVAIFGSNACRLTMKPQ